MSLKRSGEYKSPSSRRERDALHSKNYAANLTKSPSHAKANTNLNLMINNRKLGHTKNKNSTSRSPKSKEYCGQSSNSNFSTNLIKEYHTTRARSMAVNINYGQSSDYSSTVHNLNNGIHTGNLKESFKVEGGAILKDVYNIDCNALSTKRDCNLLKRSDDSYNSPSKDILHTTKTFFSNEKDPINKPSTSGSGFYNTTKAHGQNSSKNIESKTSSVGYEKHYTSKNSAVVGQSYRKEKFMSNKRHDPGYYYQNNIEINTERKDLDLRFKSIGSIDGIFTTKNNVQTPKPTSSSIEKVDPPKPKQQPANIGKDKKSGGTLHTNVTSSSIHQNSTRNRCNNNNTINAVINNTSNGPSNNNNVINTSGKDQNSNSTARLLHNDLKKKNKKKSSLERMWSLNRLNSLEDELITATGVKSAKQLV